MNTWDVILPNYTDTSVRADRVAITPRDRILSFYRGSVCVACFDGWVGYKLREVAEVSEGVQMGVPNK